MSDLQARLLEAFKIECPEHLRGIRRTLRALEGGADSDDTFYDILRHAHTLKGAARAAGLAPVERAAHDLESVFSAARSDAVKPSNSVLQAVYHLLDLIETWVSSDPSARPELPEISELQKDASRTEPVEGRPLASTAESSSTSVRLSEAALDSILLRAGEVMTQNTVHRADISRLRELLKGLRELKSSLNGKAEESGRVEVLETLCREVVQEQQARSTRFHRTAKQLFQAVSEARLVQAEGVLSGMGRMVREVARTQGKNVRYLELGLDTKVDRAVLQELKVPVMHALRNAVYHGIEPPEQRVQAGKSEIGTVELSLQLREASLVVTIADDGRGLQEEEILRKARARTFRVAGRTSDLTPIDHCRRGHRHRRSRARTVGGQTGCRFSPGYPAGFLPTRPGLQILF